MSDRTGVAWAWERAGKLGRAGAGKGCGAPSGPERVERGEGGLGCWVQLGQEKGKAGLVHWVGLDLG